MSMEAPYTDDDGDRYILEKAYWVIGRVGEDYAQGVRLNGNGLPVAVDEHGFETSLDDIVESLVTTADGGEGYYPNIAITSGFLLGLTMKERADG